MPTGTTADTNNCHESAWSAEMQQFTIDAAELGTWNLDPNENTFIGNTRLKDWFGLKATEKIELTDALNAIVAEDRQRVIDAIKIALDPSSNGTYEIEYDIINPKTKQQRSVIAKGRTTFNNGVAIRFSGILQDITERKRNEFALQQSEEQFRNLIDNSPIAMALVKGEDFIIEMANQTMLTTLWQKELGAIKGKKLMEIFPELSTQKFPLLLKEVFLTAKVHTEKEALALIDTPDGRRRVYLDFEYSPIVDCSKNVTGIFITVADVTEKVMAREQIKNDAERLLLATEGTKVATWDLDLQTKKVIHSPRMATILGLPNTTIITQDEGRQNIHPDDLINVVEKAFETALKTGNYFYEARVYHPDKSIHWMRANGKIVFDDQGTPLRMLGTLIDITEEKIAEEHIAKLAAIVSSSDDAIISKQLDGTITSWNDAAERMFGYTSEEIIGRSITTLIPTDKLYEEVDIVNQLREGKKIDHFETQRLTKDKKLIDISLTTSPIKDSKGTVIGASKIARDISRQKENERILTENKQQLEIVIDASELGTWELYLNPRRILTSPRYLEILGVDPAIDMQYDQLYAKLHPDDLAHRENAFKTAYENGVLHYITRVIWNDNSIHWVEAKGKVFYDDHRKPNKIIGTIRDLTEEKLYQQRIEESEQRFKVVADTAPVFIWLAGSDKNCTFLNKAWVNFTGRTLEHELGNGWMEGIHPDDRQLTLDHYSNSFAERKEFYLEYRLQRYDGEYRWISDTGLPRFTADGAFEGFTGARMDIHDRIIFEQKLKESEGRLRIAALSGELGTWDYNPLTKVMVHDNASKELFGILPHEQVTMELFLSKLEAEDIEPTLKKMNDALNPEVKANFDTEYRVTGLPNNEIRWIHAKGKALFNEENIAYRFSGTVLNVTEKKLALEELQENEQRYRFLADAMPQFVWTGNAEGVLNYFNKSVYDYSGLSVDEIAEAGWLQIVHPDDRQENIDKWTYAIKTGEPFLFEHRFRRHDGVYRWQLSRAVPQKDEDGKIQMWVGTSTDIDEIKKHEQQKNDFIKMANHELKTPVTTIKGYVQLLLKTHANKEDTLLTSSLTTVDKQVTKLTNLVSDLLDVTKIERGSLPLNKESFLLEGLIEDVIKDMGAASQTHKIIFNNKINAKVFADKDRISQVLINLFTNAFKYSPGREEAVVNMVAKNNQVIVSVQDFGIGIAKDDQHKIFERFYRVEGKDEKTFPGFGIGLFIVNEIIMLHNGKIWVESEKDKGATFYFSLPLLQKII